MKLNYEKRDMYAYTIGRLNKAVKNGYCYDAIMLDYAVIEDRITEILYDCGILNRTQSGLKVTNKAKKPLRALLAKKENASFGINNIQTRIEILKRLTTNNIEFSDHFSYLHSYILLKLDAEEFLALLHSVEEWKDSRNGFVHGLMEKVPYGIDENAMELTNTGYKLFRELDNVSRKIEKCNARKKYRIQ